MKTFLLIFSTMIFFLSVALFSSCATQREAVTDKSGATLWSENCVRCHKLPSSEDFSDTDWETIGLHMRIRATLTQDESEKIIEFLKNSN